MLRHLVELIIILLKINVVRPSFPVGGLPEHVPADVPRVHGRRDGAGGAQAGVLRAVAAGDGAGAAA